MRGLRVMHVLALVCSAACSPGRDEKGGSRAAPENPLPQPVVSVVPDTASGDSVAAVAILESFRAIAPTGGVGFDTAFAPQIRAASILAILSDSGLIIHDVNEEPDTTVHLTLREVEAQLTGRQGRAFESLVHLAHISSQPYSQYSELAFARMPGGLAVKVGGWYELTFVREGRRLRLRRVSYEKLEGG
jgi:hypothetical protein